MKPRVPVAVPRAAMARKPPHGAPCTNCGVCCMAVRCSISVSLFGDGGPCPALEPSGEEYTCGVINNPGRYAPALSERVGEDAVRAAAKTVLYVGEGCDARFNGEPINHVFNFINAERERLSYDKRQAAIILFECP